MDPPVAWAHLSLNDGASSIGVVSETTRNTRFVRHKRLQPLSMESGCSEHAVVREGGDLERHAAKAFTL